jgi:hypothetical protein
MDQAQSPGCLFRVPWCCYDIWAALFYGGRVAQERISMLMSNSSSDRDRDLGGRWLHNGLADLGEACLGFDFGLRRRRHLLRRIPDDAIITCSHIA